MELERLRIGLRSLHQKLAETYNRGKLCEHQTLRAPKLPCPDPDCFALPPGCNDLVFFEYQTGYPGATYLQPGELVDVGPTETKYRRCQLPTLQPWGEQLVWAWVRVPDPRSVRSVKPVPSP